MTDIFCLFLVFIDIIFFFLFKVTLFTEFQVRKIVSIPKVFNVCSVGYFQSFNFFEELEDKLDKILNGLRIEPIENYVCLHLRGGDFLSNKATAEFGKLSENYYKQSLGYGTQSARSVNSRSLVILTNDKNHAKKFFISEDKKKIIAGDLEEFFSYALGARIFISSNSTLSYFIVLLRNRAKMTSIVPSPFQLNKNFKFPNSKYIKSEGAGYR